MEILSEKIYNAVYEYCEDQGLIQLCREQLELSNQELVSKSDIGVFGLDTLDAVHCLLDRERSFLLMDELVCLAKSGDVVYEAGIGTGILSFVAAVKGACVYGLELNPETYKLACSVKRFLSREKKLFESYLVKFFLGDATNFVLDRNADIVISENIYTGLFHEKQVQIANQSLSFAKNGFYSIPQGIKNYVYLAESIFPYFMKHKEEFVPSHDRGISICSRPLSGIVEYSSFDFREHNSTLIKTEVFLYVMRSGVVNSLVIFSEIVMPSLNLIKRFDTTFLNGDIYIAIDPPIKVSKGDKISLELSYTCGNAPMEMEVVLRALSNGQNKH